MAFKLTCGLIMVLLSAVTCSTVPGVVPVGGGIFETGHAEMSRDVLYPCQGDVQTWNSLIGAIVQGSVESSKQISTNHLTFMILMNIINLFTGEGVSSKGALKAR
jgi:hypothetical protein